MPVFWKEKYWLSWSLPLLVHETNLTPSGKCQGCQGVKTIQRRVKDTAMLPLPEILIACLYVLVSPQGWHDKNVAFTLSTNISKYTVGFLNLKKKKKPLTFLSFEGQKHSKISCVFYLFMHCVDPSGKSWWKA